MKLSKRLFWTILTLFSVIFILFMSLTIYSTLLTSTEYSNDNGAGKIKNVSVLSEKEATEFENKTVLSVGNKKIAAVSLYNDSKTEKTAEQWCTYNKYEFKAFHTNFDANTLSDYDIVIFDECPTEEKYVSELKKLCENDIVIIFAKLPEADIIASNSELMDILGIESVDDKNYPIEGIRLYSDFYLSSERIYSEDMFGGDKDDIPDEIPYFRLRAGYEVYASAYLGGKESSKVAYENVPPALWKTTTENSQVCVINSELFSGDALIGTLSAFVAKTEESGVYVYPAVNAQTNTLLGFPWLQSENNDSLMEIYGHNSETLSSSVLWPDIIRSLYAYNKTANYYVSSRIDYLASAESNDSMSADAIRQIRKNMGSLGLSLEQYSDVSLSEIIDENEMFFDEFLPKWKFSSVYAGDFTSEELTDYISSDSGLLCYIAMIVVKKDSGEPIFAINDDGVLTASLTSDGLSHSVSDDIELLSVETALAYDNQYVDVARALYPRSADDYWNELDIKWSSAISYYNDFDDFDFVLSDELQNRASNMLLSDYSYELCENELVLNVNSFSGDATYYIVRLASVEPVNIDGGEITKLTETSYLVKADESKVNITLEKKYSLDMP